MKGFLKQESTPETSFMNSLSWKFTRLSSTFNSPTSLRHPWKKTSRGFINLSRILFFWTWSHVVCANSSHQVKYSHPMHIKTLSKHEHINIFFTYNLRILLYILFARVLLFILPNTETFSRYHLNFIYSTLSQWKEIEYSI